LQLLAVLAGNFCKNFAGNFAIRVGIAKSLWTVLQSRLSQLPPEVSEDSDSDDDW
jgi:hypothetical protein